MKDEQGGRGIELLQRREFMTKDRVAEPKCSYQASPKLADAVAGGAGAGTGGAAQAGGFDERD